MPGPHLALTPSPAGSLRLALDEVHCWCASLDVSPETSTRLYATLSGDERSRAARLRFRRDQEHFIVAHGALREILGRYLEIEPDLIRYVHSALGKPGLSPDFGGRLKFNLSHSDGFALIAIATDSDVGVDLERIRAHSEYAEIAGGFYSATESEQLSALPEQLRDEAFARAWTTKEACLKACGGGLTIPLEAVAPLTAGPAQGPVEVRVAPNDVVPATRWSVHPLQPAPGYVGALAVAGSCWRLSQWRWTASQG